MVISDGPFSSNILYVYNTRLKILNSEPELQAQVFSHTKVFLFVEDIRSYIFLQLSIYHLQIPFSINEPRKKRNVSKSLHTIFFFII